jgi:hypothetical protein
MCNTCTLCAFLRTFHTKNPKEFLVSSLPSPDLRTLSQFRDDQLTVPLALQVGAEWLALWKSRWPVVEGQSWCLGRVRLQKRVVPNAAGAPTVPWVVWVQPARLRTLRAVAEGRSGRLGRVGQQNGVAPNASRAPTEGPPTVPWAVWVLQQACLTVPAAVLRQLGGGLISRIYIRANVHKIDKVCTS